MKKSKIGAWAVALLVAVSLIPVDQAEAKTVDEEYPVTINIKEGKEFGAVRYTINGTGGLFQPEPGETGTLVLMVPVGVNCTFSIMPGSRGRIDYIYFDGALKHMNFVESDLTQMYEFTLDSVKRSHTIEVGFSNRQTSIENVPKKIGTAEVPFVVGQSQKLTPSSAYGQLKYLTTPLNTIKVYDIRGSGNSDGSIWIRALKPGTTQLTYGWLSSQSKKNIDVEVSAATSGKHSIFALASAHGQFNFPGSQEVDEGETITYSVVPDNGYWINTLTVDDQLVYLTDADKKGNYNYTFTNVKKSHDIIATFKEADELVMPQTRYDGLVGETLRDVKPNPNYGTWVYDNEYVEGKARNQDANRVFDFELKKAGTTEMTYHVNGKKETVFVTINEPPKKYITATTGLGGSINPFGDNILVEVGTNQTFTITPASTYMIDQVLVDNADVTNHLQGNTYTFANVTDNHTIHATFKKIVIGGLPSTEKLLMGDSVSLTPTPSGGTWKVDDDAVLSFSEQGGNVTFTGKKVGATKATYTLNGVSWEVSFTVETLPVGTITASAGVNGTITPSGNIQVEFGSDKTFTLVADQHYMIDKLLVDGVEATPQLQNNVYTYTFTNVRNNHQIEVSFVPLIIGDLEDKEMFVGESVDSTTPDTGDFGYAWYMIVLALAGGSSLLLVRKKKTI